MRPVPACFCLIALLTASARGEDQPERYVRIGHYQCVCRQGDFEANLKTVIHGLELAADARVQILSFPECFLTGFFRSRDDTWTHSFAADSPQIRQVLQQTARFDILFMVGFNERRGDKLFNTVAVIDRGKLLGTYSKAFPEPCYSPGRDFPVFQKHGLMFGVIICADGGYIEPARILALKGATVIFAPHFNFVSDALEHYQTTRSDHTARAIENGVYFVRGNSCMHERKLAGVPGEGFSYGESYVINPNGQVVAGAGLYDQYLMIYNLNLNKKYRSGGIRRSRKSAQDLLDALQQAVKESR